MSSETGSIERGGSADSWLTQYDLVNPEKRMKTLPTQSRTEKMLNWQRECLLV